MPDSSLDSRMQRLSDWASRHPWGYVLVGPLLLIYIIYKLPGALRDWGHS